MISTGFGALSNSEQFLVQMVGILEARVLTELFHTVINQLLFLLLIRDSLRLQVTRLLKTHKKNKIKKRRIFCYQQYRHHVTLTFLV